MCIRDRNQLSDYSKAALPAIFTAAAACGAVGSASAKYAATCLALDVLMSLSQKLIIPLVYSYLALAVAGSVFPNYLLSNTAKLTKWMAVTVMTAMTIAFSAYIGMTLSLIHISQSAWAPAGSTGPKRSSRPKRARPC